MPFFTSSCLGEERSVQRMLDYAFKSLRILSYWQSRLSGTTLKEALSRDA